MAFKLFFYLFLSIVVVGLYHWAYQWFHDSFSYYFTLSKVKKTDKLFELGEMDSSHEEDAVVSVLEYVEKEEGKKGEEKGEEMGKEEDLFQFIDGL
jgi:hypothetical protein